MNPTLKKISTRCGLIIIGFCLPLSLHAEVLLPSLAPNLVCRYDFDHPVPGDATKETDLGSSGTAINLINGGAAMRTNDGAYPGSIRSLQTQQFSPTVTSNDDWKAGIYQAGGVASLTNFSAATGITLMGWVKPTGTNPNLDTTTASPTDYYNAVGLFGLLSGNSDGHGVRALLEVIEVGGTLRLVALGRRIDTGSSLILAATNDWRTLVTSNKWTHLAATFDFDNGVMALYRNGVPIGATYTTAADTWGIIGGAEPDVTSSTSPAGIKIGGSYPQNTQEKNAFNGRLDDVMFFNKVLGASEVQQQYANFVNPTNAPVLKSSLNGSQIVLSWPAPAAGFSVESNTNLATGNWTPAAGDQATNGQNLFVTFPISAAQQFFRLKKP